MADLRQRARVQEAVRNLRTSPSHPFPKEGEPFPADLTKTLNSPGVYLIENRRGDVLHIGRTLRNRPLRERLRDHLNNKSSFSVVSLDRDGRKLSREGCVFRAVGIPDEKQRAYVEALAIGKLCPKHIGTGRAPMPTSSPPKTFISDVRPSRAATIEAAVAKLEPIREITQRDGVKKKVRNGRLKDDTGEISLVLWGDEVELVVEGDRVRIVEGWVKDYQGQPQISLGRTGRLEKL